MQNVRFLKLAILNDLRGGFVLSGYLQFGKGIKGTEEKYVQSSNTIRISDEIAAMY